MTELPYGISDSIDSHPCQYIVCIGYPFSGRMTLLHKLFDTLEATLQEPMPTPDPEGEPIERLIFRLEAVTYPNGETLRR
jgi:hypothetical protein